MWYFITSYDVHLSHCAYTIVEFCILSKTECNSIYYHFRRDHENSSFWKLAVETNGFVEKLVIFFVIKTVFNIRMDMVVN